MKFGRTVCFLGVGFAPSVVWAAYDFDALNVTDNYLVLNLGYCPGGVSVGTGGITVSDSVRAGFYAGGADGNIYVEPSAFVNDGLYTFLSSGNINVANLLAVDDGFNLNVSGGNSPINITIGTIKNGETESGTINSLSFKVINNLVAGTLQNLNGVTYVDATGDISVGNSGSYGLLQNLGKGIDLLADGDISVFGTLEGSNTGGYIHIESGGNFIVSGNVTESTSIINNGDLYALINGTTTLAHGFDLSGMEFANVFDFTTGNLIVNDGEPYSWVNDLNSFKLVLNDSNSVLDAGNIQNGVNNLGTANMSIAAATINAIDVVNKSRDLSLSAYKDINLTGNIRTDKGSTDVYASGKINAGETSVVNNALTQIVGTSGIVLKSLSNNSGGELVVSTNTAADHSLVIVSDIINASGEMTIKGNNISVGGGIISDGDIGSDFITVYGTGIVSFGNIDVNGGTFNLDGLAGTVTSDGGLNVTDGTLNLGKSLTQLSVAGDVIFDGAVKLSDEYATSAGDVNIFAYGNTSTSIISDGKINISGGLSAVADDLVRLAKFDSDDVLIGTTENSAGVVSSNKGALVLGNAVENSKLVVAGEIFTTDGGSIDMQSKYVTAESLKVSDGKLIVRGESVTINNGGMDIADGLWFDTLMHSKGLSVLDTHDIILRTNSGADIAGGIDVSEGNVLKLISATDVDVKGLVNIGGDLNVVANRLFADNDISIFNGGNITVSADVIDAEYADLMVVGTIDVFGRDGVSNAASIKFLDITNTGVTNINANDVLLDNATITSGKMTVNGDDFYSSGFTVDNAEAYFNFDNSVSISDLLINGNLYQGGYAGTNGLWLLGNANIIVNDANIAGDFIASSGNVEYTITDKFDIAGDINVDTGAQVSIAASKLYGLSIQNLGKLNLDIDSDLLIDVIDNAGTLEVDSPYIKIVNLKDTGKSVFSESDYIVVENSADISGVLYQNKADISDSKYMNIISDDYVFSAGNFKSGGINQVSGNMQIDSGNVFVAGSIDALGDGLVIGSDEYYLTAEVHGNISDNVHLKDLQRLYVGQDYVFGNNSIVEAMILPNGAMTGSYWSHVDSEGNIVNADDGASLISVGQRFVFDLGAGNINSLLDRNQINLTMFDIADTDDAIWLVGATDGIENMDSTIVNFTIKYCNSDGSICVDYPDATSLIHRDLSHNMYLIFDSSLEVGYIQKIQPVVDTVPGRSDSAYFAAGVIDDLVAHQLNAKGFYNKTPIDVLPIIFENTKMYDMASALADRMNAFIEQRDGRLYERFSRLFEARDAEQLVGNIALNEHTYFRNFEDRMIDEFLWNRNRNLNKAWLDVDYGLFTQKTSEDVDADGNRFGISAGFDWQQAKSLILGLTAHFNHLKSDANDTFNVGYLPPEEINGFVDTSITDNNFGFGAYLMQNLGQKARLYGNAFMDLHALDVERKQNYVSDISGDGIAFSVISEWGLLHDWLNQYITGNLYARVGYNTGFDITEKTAGADYMDLKSGGYGILTPGYTLTAQKRIYPSSWFQIRPYVSVGAEYDVLGVPDQIKYKFAVVDNWTDYDVDINPLWINGGLGVELVSATGLQVGLDYRYQHNSDIQLHNFKLSGSYRF